MQLNLPGLDAAFKDLVDNKGLSNEVAKSFLTNEALLINLCGIMPLEKPICSELWELCNDEQVMPDMLRIFYGIYSCQELPEEIEFDTDQIIVSMKEAIENIDISELLSYPEKFSEFLPKNSISADLFSDLFSDLSPDLSDNNDDLWTRKALLRTGILSAKLINDIIKDANEEEIND